MFSASSSTQLISSMKNCIDKKRYHQALDLFDQLAQSRTNASIAMALKACTHLKDYQRGLNIIQQLSSSSLLDQYIQNSLIQFYMTCNDVDNADRVFSAIAYKSNVTYTVRFKGYISNGMPEKVLDLVDQMTLQPNQFTLAVIFKACAQVNDERARSIGNRLLKEMSTAFRDDVVLLNSVTSMLMAFGDVEQAEEFFRSIQRKTVVSYIVMMKGYIGNDLSEKALDLFEQMSAASDNIIRTLIFDACAQLKNERAVNIGMKLLDQILKKSNINQIELTSAIHMLMSFRDVRKAEELFTSMTKKDVVSYGAMMRGYIKNDMSEKALDLFEQMSVAPDNVIHILIFDACGQLKNERAKNIGKKLLRHILKKSNIKHVVPSSAIHMLMSFGDVEGAEHLFQLIDNKNTSTFAAMIRGNPSTCTAHLNQLIPGYVDNDVSEKALDLFEQMSLKPDNAMYARLFSICAKLKNERTVNLGKTLLHQLSNQSNIANIVSNSVVHMLMKFGDVNEAVRWFELIKRKDVISYGALMHGYLENDMCEKVLDSFEQMSVDPDPLVHAAVLKACAHLKNERAINIGKKLLDQIFNTTMTNQLLSASAIHMLMSFGDVEGAEHLFQLIDNKNTSTFAAMIRGYVDNDVSEKALDLFEQMSLKPDNAMYAVLFSICAKLKNERTVNLGKTLLHQLSNQSNIANVVSNSVVHMLMKFGDVNEAVRWFELIKRKDVISYGALMQGYLENDMCEKVLDSFEQMSVDPDPLVHAAVLKACAHLKNERAINIGKKLLDQIFNTTMTNPFLSASAINMLISFGDVKGAEHLFQSIPDKNISTYASMMKSYNLNEQPLQCLQLFNQIKQEDLLSNEIIFIPPISACAQLGILAVCESFVPRIPSHLHTQQRITNVLIDMWGKAGSVTKAQEIFATTDKTDIITYNSMINAFGLNGRGAEAIDLFQQTSYHARNEITYVCTLNACSHAGLLNQARAIFDQINLKTRRITTTMIDCLSRLFLFEEAHRILAEYEMSNPPCLPMYMAILSGARNCRDSTVSIETYNKMQTLFPGHKNDLASGAILLANIHSSLGDDDQAAIIRTHRRTNYGNKVKPGLTWTEKDGEIAEFTAHGSSHPLSIEIHDEAKELQRERAQYGHRCDPSWVTRPLGEDETIESILCGHSEQLAIAFHFIRGRRPSFIQVTKNLRICGECHQATKLTAMIRQCEIILRDANRIHHFYRNGTCSCQDHF